MQNKEMTKEQKAVEFVENFIKYGFRIDTMPTRMFFTPATDQRTPLEAQNDEYMWWHEYVSGAERRLREAARNIVDGK